MWSIDVSFFLLILPFGILPLYNLAMIRAICFINPIFPPHLSSDTASMATEILAPLPILTPTTRTTSAAAMTAAVRKKEFFVEGLKTPTNKNDWANVHKTVE